MANEKELFTLEEPHGNGTLLLSWQRGRSGYLATSGFDNHVHIYNRVGQRCDQVRLKGTCIALTWDAEGDLLAVITNNSHIVTLWDSHTLKVTQVDTGLRDPLSCIMWAKTGQILAVATSKGNISIYNHNTAKRVPVLGKHTRKINCGAWNASMMLGLCSEDRTISLSNVDGDTLKTISLRGDPSHIMFSEMKLDERSGEDNTISVVVSKKTLFLYNLNDPDNPVELAFQPRYGHVVTYKWFDDGYILLGFSSGFFIAISTHIKEVGQELFQIKNHKENLTDVALNKALRKVASAGDNQVKIHDMSNLQEVVRVITLNEDNCVDKICWSDDGQLLAVTTKSGSCLVYLSQLTGLAVTNGTQIAVLSSLTEVSVHLCSPEELDKPVEHAKVDVAVEPSVLGVGPYHVIAAMNNIAYFYDLVGLDGTGPCLMREQEYLNSITSIKLNKEYCSIFYGTTLQLHMIEVIETRANDDREAIMFPGETTQNIVITCHELLNDFLIYATDMGNLYYFSLTEWKQTVEMKHNCGIREIFPDLLGRRLVIVDEKSEGYIYSALEEGNLLIDFFPEVCLGVIWDQVDKDIFAAYDASTMYTFVHRRQSIYGSNVKPYGKTQLAMMEKPLMMSSGHVVTMRAGGTFSLVTLATHIEKIRFLDTDHGKLEQIVKSQISMCRFDKAYSICTLLAKEQLWRSLAEEALKSLNIELAIRIYRDLDDVAMVMCLSSIKAIECKLLLSGHIAMFVREFDVAQEWYLKSELPRCALEMRKDLLHWEKALQLAQKLSAKDLPYVAAGYAQQLEFTGTFTQALFNYERGLVDGGDDAAETHLARCRGGIARMAIRCGDARRGITMASEPGTSRELKMDCAEILEEMKLFGEAGTMYEKGGFITEAASAYIRVKNWTAVGKLLPNIVSPKLHIQYAKASEADGKYETALHSYEIARDYESVIRVYLDHFNHPKRAIEIVQEHYSVEGAKMIARYFQRNQDYGSAIRFLAVSGCIGEAFVMARQHKQLKLLGETLISQLTVGVKTPKPSDFVSLAKHYEIHKDNLLAGKFFFYSQMYQQSLNHLMRASASPSDEQEALSLCIDAVTAAKDEYLTKQLFDFLLGERDGIAKDAKFIFRLYMARRQFKEATKTAIIISNDEQIRGNYRSAHDILLGLYRDLKLEGLSVPSEMRENLALLHLYTLVRIHVRKGNHKIAARLLMRVSENISKFPAHIVPILTSTVIECSRAGLKQAAFSYAVMLMRPEYRSQLDPKYARKMEGVVRKPPKTAGPDVEEETTPCPVCVTELSNTELNCTNCKTTIPFCMATGRHIVKDDFTVCPHCDFPAIYTELKVLVEGDEPCPMCSELIYPERLTRIQDLKPYLQSVAED